MTAKWMLEHRFKRFFENNFELRARTSAGILKDVIRKGAFARTLEDEFTPGEIKDGLKHGIIGKDQVREGVMVKNIYFWLEGECLYQPVWYKRYATNVGKKFSSYWNTFVELWRCY